MARSDSWSVAGWYPALLRVTTVAWATGIKRDPNDYRICSILRDQNQARLCKKTQNKTTSRKISLSPANTLRGLCKWACFFSLNYDMKNPNKAEFMSNPISHSSWTYLKKAEAWGDRTDRTTEALEASPPCLICTQSQIQYSQPFFSLSSDSVRALSLMGRRDADGWMTVG